MLVASVGVLIDCIEKIHVYELGAERAALHLSRCAKATS